MPVLRVHVLEMHKKQIWMRLVPLLMKILALHDAEDLSLDSAGKGSWVLEVSTLQLLRQSLCQSRSALICKKFHVRADRI